MITSIHTLIYSDDANATRALLRDVLGRKYIAEDFDNVWLIFKSGSSEMGVHPTHSEWKGQTYDYPRHHSIALMCDDIDTTVGELQAKGTAIPRFYQATRVRPRHHDDRARRG
jgi:catechol 2,3-dioxygenase-like lactoylglutathione lyase family enzyme